MNKHHLFYVTNTSLLSFVVAIGYGHIRQKEARQLVADAFSIHYVQTTRFLFETRYKILWTTLYRRKARNLLQLWKRRTFCKTMRIRHVTGCLPFSTISRDDIRRTTPQARTWHTTRFPKTGPSSTHRETRSTDCSSSRH